MPRSGAGLARDDMPLGIFLRALVSGAITGLLVAWLVRAHGWPGFAGVLLLPIVVVLVELGVILSDLYLRKPRDKPR